MLMPAVAIPASLLAGWAADRVRNPLVVPVVGLLFAATLATFTVVPADAYGLVTLTALAVAFGITGALIPLLALPRATVAAAAAGRATGIATSSAMSGAIISTFLGGVVVSTTGGYALASLVFAGVAAFAAIAIMPAIAAGFARRGIRLRA